MPIAAHARLLHGKMVMDGLVGSVAGDRIVKSHAEGKPEDAKALGMNLAEDLLSKGADKILAEVYGRCINQIDPP